MTILKLIEKYSKDAEYRIHKIANLNPTQDDLILLMRDVSEMVRILERFRDSISKTLTKYIEKN